MRSHPFRYSPHWRIPVISPGGGFNYHFDNKREYQLLTRMLHSSKTIVHFISRVILPHFNWTSVRIIAERNVIESQVSLSPSTRWTCLISPSSALLIQSERMLYVNGCPMSSLAKF